MSSRPTSQVCPFHSEEVVQPVYLGGETAEWEFRCPLEDHPVQGPFCWAAPEETSVDLGGALGLDLRTSLPAAVKAASDDHGGGWVEYGLVERAWAQRNPEDWAMLLGRFDHRWFHRDAAPTRATLPYTASKYLGGRLGALSRLGDVLYRDGRGTGYWRYLQHVSYWAPPAADLVSVRTWEQAGVEMDHLPKTRPAG